MKCCVCNNKTSFVKAGWFGIMMPFCTDHYGLMICYGGGVELSNSKGEQVDMKYPQNTYTKV